MPQRRRTVLACAVVLAATATLSGVAAPTGAAGAVGAVEPSPGAARLLGVTTLPSGLRLDGSVVGGLSGIDRDPSTGAYHLIADDRSELGPARTYTAAIDLSAGAPQVELTGVRTLLRDDRAPYPSLAAWTATAWANLGLEAFTFADCGRLVTSVLEGPLLQDGPEPTATEGALVRLSVQNRGGVLQGQYAYPVDPVGGAPGANGVAAVLADPARAGRYLVLERTVVLGQGTRVRIHAVDIPSAPGNDSDAATDISDVDSLASTSVRPLRKDLVLDLGDLGVRPGIVEGMTWGPALPTGERSLVLVADDNFALRPIPGVAQVSQVIAVALADDETPGPRAGC